MSTNEAAEIAGPRLAPDSTLGLMNERAAAAFLGYSVRALQNWRLRGGGPQYVKVSAKSIRYQRGDLQAWINARLCNDTAMGHAVAASITHASRRGERRFPPPIAAGTQCEAELLNPEP